MEKQHVLLELTHVPTADTRILEKGTAYQTDIECAEIIIQL